MKHRFSPTSSELEQLVAIECNSLRVSQCSLLCRLFYTQNSVHRFTVSVLCVGITEFREVIDECIGCFFDVSNRVDVFIEDDT